MGLGGRVSVQKYCWQEIEGNDQIYAEKLYSSTPVPWGAKGLGLIKKTLFCYKLNDITGYTQKSHYVKPHSLINEKKVLLGIEW